MMSDKELLELKKKIETSKQKASELKGKQEVLMATLKKDYNCNSIGEATKKIKMSEDKILDLEKKKKKGIQELENKYNLR